MLFAHISKLSDPLVRDLHDPISCDMPPMAQYPEDTRRKCDTPSFALGSRPPLRGVSERVSRGWGSKKCPKQSLLSEFGDSSENASDTISVNGAFPLLNGPFSLLNGPIRRMP